MAASSTKKGVVDYTIGKGVAPGVFVIVEATHPRIIERMDDLHIGNGPYYSFFRPYHLTSLEVPLTAARIMLYGRPDMVPLPSPVAEVCARRQARPRRRRDLRCDRRDLLPLLDHDRRARRAPSAPCRSACSKAARC